MNSGQIIKAGLVLCLLYVVIGAFGAHGLSEMIGDMRNTFDTGSEYHGFHGLGLIAIGMLGKQFNIDMRWAAYAMIFGVLLFSGSLYLMSVYKMKLGLVTPIGGVGFVAGWVVALRKVFLS
jgi:uncharacterized membrane protein YgdD (TMEM256/DUF423 family)